jgi:hypothetical protein
MYYVHLQKLCRKEDCASSVTSMQVRSLCHKNLNFVVSSVLQEWVKKLHIIINVFISISFGSDFAECVSILVNIEALNDIFSCWDLLISYWTIQEPHAYKSE